MFVIALSIGIFTWAIAGKVIDALEDIINSMSNLFSPSLLEVSVNTSDAFGYAPFVILCACVVFLIVRGLRRSDDGIR